MKQEDLLENKNKYIGKYNNKNFISRYLVNSFYKDIIQNIHHINNEVTSALEVGCGHGISTLTINEELKVERFEASDFDEEGYLLNDARKYNPEITFKKESIYELNRSDGEFDLIVSLEVLEHLEDARRGLEELKRVTNNYCLVSVPNEPIWKIMNMLRGKYWSNWGNTPGHLNNWSKNEFVSLISEYFDIIKVKNPLPWTIVLAKKKNQ